MLNIMLIGFEMQIIEELEAEVKAVVKNLNLLDSCKITSISAKTQDYIHGRPEPYAIVRCASSYPRSRVVEALNSKLGLSVEIVSIKGYLEGNPGSHWNQAGR